MYCSVCHLTKFGSSPTWILQVSHFLTWSARSCVTSASWQRCFCWNGNGCRFVDLAINIKLNRSYIPFTLIDRAFRNAHSDITALICSVLVSWDSTLRLVWPIQIGSQWLNLSYSQWKLAEMRGCYQTVWAYRVGGQEWLHNKAAAQVPLFYHRYKRGSGIGNSRVTSSTHYISP